MAFDLTLGFSDYESSNCDDIEGFSEGVELSVKRNNGEWIPLMFFAPPSEIEEPFINLSKHTDSERPFTLRGYTVPYIIQAENIRNYNISICRNDIFTDRLQFRWLQTSYQRGESAQDVVVLENIIVRAWNCSNNVTLLSSIK